MTGTYFEYNKNIFRIKEYDSYGDSIKIELIKQTNKEFCFNIDHSSFIKEGEMWPMFFFKHAKPLINGDILYGE